MRAAHERTSGSEVVPMTTTLTPLIPRAVCPDCGFEYKYVEDLDSHDLHCMGPIKLVFTPGGLIFGEVGSE
jgi:hypothetical protein